MHSKTKDLARLAIGSFIFGLLFCFNLPFALAQGGLPTPAPRVFVGTIVDYTGSPIKGAFVFAKGKQKAVFCTDSGAFSISLLPSDTVLVGQATSYAATEFVIKDTLEPINIILIKLPPRVTTFFGEVPVSENYSSISSIDSKPLKTASQGNFAGSLQGLAPGLHITSSSGLPSAEVVARIRGFGSLVASSDPLVVLDGMPIISGENGDGGGSVGQTYGFSTSPAAITILATNNGHAI